MFLETGKIQGGTIKVLLAFILTFETIEGGEVAVHTCDNDCSEWEAKVEDLRAGLPPAKSVMWDLDLAIEAQPVWGKDPKELFENLFHVVDRDGQKIAGLTDTRVDLQDVHWTADLDCDNYTPQGARLCIVSDGSPRFEWHHLITGGPMAQNEGEGLEKLTAVSNSYYAGLPVIRPKVKVRVYVGWPAMGMNNLPESWRRPILESVYLILGHEKLHVDNFLRHLPEIAQIVLHPGVAEFELLPGEDPRVKLDSLARTAALDAINRELFDANFSNCKRLNCQYDGKGEGCDGVAQHDGRRIAAAWDVNDEWSSSGENDLKLQMVVDRQSHYPGPKSPFEFKFPKPFDFRWARK